METGWNVDCCVDWCWMCSLDSLWNTSTPSSGARRAQPLAPQRERCNRLTKRYQVKRHHMFTTYYAKNMPNNVKHTLSILSITIITKHIFNAFQHPKQLPRRLLTQRLPVDAFTCACSLGVSFASSALTFRDELDFISRLRDAASISIIFDPHRFYTQTLLSLWRASQSVYVKKTFHSQLHLN